ncbi:MAG: bifunctional metallophosphatase/5'-nucleotidase [Flavobacteriaceae bacterium]|nr:bifunctional metallophosphatase/5'-nucleotidase [Flavobacteriaceae bacterium]
MKNISLFFVVLFLTSCYQEDSIVKVTFLQLNDVYEIAALEGGKVGGMARVETLHKELLAENSNTFLVMAGDFLNPSLIGTLKYKGKRIRGKQMIETMNAMHFDLVCFGNHEFDLKYDDLQERLNESNFKWISTNVLHKIDSVTLKPFYIEKNNVKTNIERTYIHEFKNKKGKSLKIGFIAPTINSNPKNYVDYGDFYQDSKNAYNSIKDKTDLVIGLTHLKQSQDEMIAKMLPEIPLIMGGHEHTNRLIPINNCKIAKADANAKTAYVHRLEYNLKTKEHTITSTLVAINNSIKPAKEIAQIVQKWNALLDEKIKKILPNPKEIIYVAKTPLNGRDTPIRSIQTNLGKLITEGMAFGFDNKVDCAIVNGGSIRVDDQLKGNITGIDIFRVLPYGGSVLKVKIKGSLLEKVLNYGNLKAGTGAYLQRFKATLDKDERTWLISNKPIIKNNIYTVAFSEYLLKGLDIPFLKSDNKDVINVYTPKPKELNSDIRKSIISYMKKKYPKNK